MDSNHRRYKPADLQSAPFGHSGTPPLYFSKNAQNLICSDFGVANVQAFVYNSNFYRKKYSRIIKKLVSQKVKNDSITI